MRRGLRVRAGMRGKGGGARHASAAHTAARGRAPVATQGEKPGLQHPGALRGPAPRAGHVERSCAASRACAALGALAARAAAGPGAPRRISAESRAAAAPATRSSRRISVESRSGAAKSIQQSFERRRVALRSRFIVLEAAHMTRQRSHGDLRRIEPAPGESAENPGDTHHSRDEGSASVRACAREGRRSKLRSRRSDMAARGRRRPRAQGEEGGRAAQHPERFAARHPVRVTSVGSGNSAAPIPEILRSAVSSV